MNNERGKVMTFHSDPKRGEPLRSITDSIAAAVGKRSQSMA
jgi:hypothetical protein